MLDCIIALTLWHKKHHGKCLLVALLLYKPFFPPLQSARKTYKVKVILELGFVLKFRNTF